MTRLNTTVDGCRPRRGGGRGRGGFGGGGSEPQWSRDSRSIYMLIGRRHLFDRRPGGSGGR